MKMSLDEKDRQILKEMQIDTRRPVAEIAAAVSLSQNACWRRIRLMEEAGVIRKQVALIDADLVGLGITVFVQVRTSDHSADWLDRFSKGVARIDEVVEFHRLNGSYDYLLKIVVPSIADYDRVYRRLISAAPLHDVTSCFSMERIKETTALPIDAMPAARR
ncbi:Lrp/AsnC family transcriptional regulator [Minwuia sp.]|uniref:Lrp/AsnC family transcriptional regulator n=1 Tax=Minwuia sp. TaxID=2493630 RepID=UPI003A945050